jgi:hypothetical protein
MLGGTLGLSLACLCRRASLVTGTTLALGLHPARTLGSRRTLRSRLGRSLASGMVATATTRGSLASLCGRLCRSRRGLRDVGDSSGLHLAAATA